MCPLCQATSSLLVAFETLAGAIFSRRGRRSAASSAIRKSTGRWRWLTSVSSTHRQASVLGALSGKVSHSVEKTSILDLFLRGGVFWGPGG